MNRTTTPTPATKAATTNNHTFEVDHYTVMACLNERTIYLKITDRVAFLCYEGNIDENDLRLSIGLKDSYRLLCNCFAREEGHGVNCVVNSGTLRLVFDAFVGGYLNLHTELLLHELVMSNDSQLTVNFLRLEQQLEPLIKQNQKLLQRVNDLEQRLEGVADCGVIMYLPQHAHSNNQSPYQLNAIEISVPNHTGFYFGKIRNFYRLKKLGFHGANALYHASFREANLSSMTLEHLVLKTCSIMSLEGIDQLPNLKKLELQSCQSLQPFVDILKSYRHKIQEIVVVSCPGVNQVALTTYCTQSNIRLSLS